jgi:hypothetical protein
MRLALALLASSIAAVHAGTNPVGYTVADVEAVTLISTGSFAAIVCL